MDQGSRPGAIHWVVREVLVHEPALRTWLKKAIHANDASEVEDIIQESYCRILNLRNVSHIRNGRAYLFTTARMIILERIRKSKIVNIETIAELENLQIPSESSPPDDTVIYKNYLDQIKKIISALPDRCRSVFQMRKIEGLSQREVASRLGVAEHTVENDVAKGLTMILRAIADGEQQAEMTLERMGRHGRAWLSTGNQ